jgi:large repetitive protein
MAASAPGIKVSFSNTPQAEDDAFTNAGITEDSTGVFLLDVMANDAGGNGKSLYSLHATGDQNALLSKDDVGAINLSALGAKVWITSDGKVAYQLTPEAMAKLQSLSVGEITADTFAYAIQLGNGTLSWANANVRLTGVNDVSVVNLDSIHPDVTDSVNVQGALTATGSINFTDVDKADTHTTSVSAVGSTLGQLTVNVAQDSTGTATGTGKLTWTYSVDAGKTDYLGQGETRTESFMVTLKDQQGGTVTQQVDVVITGTNDAPVLTAGSDTGTIADGALKATGSFGLIDADQHDGHTISVAGTNGSTNTGRLTAQVDPATHLVTWTYEADGQAVAGLAEGEQKVESFIVSVADQNGGVATKQVNVTLVGKSDVAVIDISTSTVSGAVTDGTALTASGKLNLTDADIGQANFVVQTATKGSNAYGAFSLGADGNWTYAADSTKTQALAAGETVTDSFTAVSQDGTARQVVTVTITGTNDVAVINSSTSTSAGAINDGAVLSTSGTLNITDADHDQAGFTHQQGTQGSNGYGTFGLDASGAWTYVADRTKVQALGAGETVTDSFTAVSLDGTASQKVTVTIAGTNDAAIIDSTTSTATGAVTDGASHTVSGKLNVTDADHGQSGFVAQTETQGNNAYGSFSLGSDGAWNYAADSSKSQALGEGETATDSFTAVSKDGTASQVVTVTITGTNDAATIDTKTSTVTGVVLDGAAQTVSGKLNVTDADAGQAKFVAQTATEGSSGFGKFALNSDGTWGYAADGARTQALAAGETVTDSFTAVSQDGTARQVVTVTITGTNDTAIIDSKTSTVSGSVTDGGAPSASGKLTVSDADHDQAGFTSQQNTQGSSGYGAFDLASDGTWGYKLDQQKAQAVAAGETVIDSFTAVSLDGTASQTVTVTITGTNDAAVIDMSKSTASAVMADGGSLTASGKLVVSDADNGESGLKPQTGTEGSAGMGTFSASSDGTWSYAADGEKVKALAVGETVTDSFTAVSKDGSASQAVTVTITGTNDAAVIDAGKSTASGTLADGAGLTSSGTLVVADADKGEAGFQGQNGTPGSAGYGKFTLGTDGTWNYGADEAKVNSLAAGETVTDSFTAVSKDGTASQLVSVTITGANDAPIITGLVDFFLNPISDVVDVPAIAEVQATGYLNFQDADLTDRHQVTVMSAEGNLGTLTANMSVDSHQYSANDGQVMFEYAASPEAVKGLADGETKTDHFTVSLSDGHGGVVEKELQFKVTGTNDAPVVTGGVFEGTIYDNAFPTISSIPMNVIGKISFTDADLGDEHTVAVTLKDGSQIAGNISTHMVRTSTGEIDVHWNFNPVLSAIDRVAGGEKATTTFTVSLSDGKGGVVEKDVTVTVNGANDRAFISGTSTGTVNEDEVVSATGTLTVADADHDQSSFAAQSGAAGASGYGTFSLNAAGNWSYALDNGNAAVQALNAGQTLTDSFTATSLDGSASEVVTVTINGSNDTATIGGSSAGTVTEDTSFSTGGTLTISDADSGQTGFVARTNVGSVNGYGSFNVTAEGDWSYTLNNSNYRVQMLTPGRTLTEYFTVQSLDGSSEQTITVTINGTNDAPAIIGEAVIHSENAILFQDADFPDMHSVTVQTNEGNIGTLTAKISTESEPGRTDGEVTWSYDVTPEAIKQLPAGTHQDVFEVVLTDSHGASVTKTLTFDHAGVNDAPVITDVRDITRVPIGDLIIVDERNEGRTDGFLTFQDADPSDKHQVTVQSADGNLGTMTAVMYHDSSQAGEVLYEYAASPQAVRGLGAGETRIDRFTVSLSDGKGGVVEKELQFKVTGTNDVAVIGGASTGVAMEDSNAMARGVLTISDPDQGQSYFAPVTSLRMQYGEFNMGPEGNWDYRVNQNSTVVQALNAGQTLTDSFTATSLDGSASQVVTVTINGVNDPAVISGTATGAVKEDTNVSSGLLKTTGTLSISDVDNAGASFAAQTNVKNVNGYGSFSLTADGAWTYSVSNSNAAVQALSAAGALTENFTARSLDGTASQVVTVTINGTNDVAVISNASAAIPEVSNAGFESGTTITGWSSPGTITVLTNGGSLGNNYASINPSDVALKLLTAQGESNLGLVAGSVNRLYNTTPAPENGNKLGYGEVKYFNSLKHDPISVKAGQTILFDWKFDHGNAISNNFAAITMGDGNLVELADVNGLKAAGLATTGWKTYGYVAEHNMILKPSLLFAAGGTSTTENSRLYADNLRIVENTVMEDQNVAAGTHLLKTSGKLNITDVDSGQTSFVAQTNVTNANGYGSFNLAADGTWTYSVSNDNVAVNALKSTEKLTESFTATSLDGSASRVVTVSVYGADELVKTFDTSNYSFEVSQENWWPLWNSLGDFDPVQTTGASFSTRSIHKMDVATDGTKMAFLGNYGSNSNLAVTQTAIESFVGLAAHSLDDVSEGQVIRTSAVKTRIDAEAGQTVSFDYRYSHYSTMSPEPVTYFLVYLGSERIGTVSNLDVKDIPSFSTTSMNPAFTAEDPRDHQWRTFNYEIDHTAAAETISIVTVVIGSAWLDLGLDNLRIV